MCSTSGNNETNKAVKKVGITEIHLWNMELRTNNVCMDEHNVDVKKKKIEEFEKIGVQRRQDRVSANEQRERAYQEKEKTNDGREQENEQGERTNISRELANDERERRNKNREKANDKREITKDHNELVREENVHQKKM